MISSQHTGLRQLDGPDLLIKKEAQMSDGNSTKTHQDPLPSCNEKPSPSYFKYDRSKESWQKAAANTPKSKPDDFYLKQNTYDNWRHYRMRAPLKAIISADPEASWLTVGDGLYGGEAHFLISAGAKHVHCSDISDALLKIGHEHGAISSFSAENAENISFADNSFDYVYCKEAFHHFPRPFIALYEMFRVARKGVILTEPRDTTIDTAPIQELRNVLKALVGRKPSKKHGFESVGNYAYALSEREVEKFLLGMHYTHAAFIGCNDLYESGIGNIHMQSEAVGDKKKIARAKQAIKYKDLICRIGVRRSTILTAAMFKSEPAQRTKNSLTDAGWTVKDLPKNPYL